jgi:LuxR family transcriptional regulator
MFEAREGMAAQLSRLESIAPRGYAAGIRIRFATPLYLVSTFPAEWQALYRERGFSLRDPLLAWGVSRTGTIRWSESRLPDPFGVLRQAARHGLVYGASASTGRVTSRSVVGIARQDREFTDAEIAELADVTQALHDATEPPPDLDTGLIEALRLTAEGFRPVEAAIQLGIDETELVARIDAARATLGVGSTAQAIQLAREYKLM